MKTWRWAVAPVLALTLTGCTCAQKNAPPPPPAPPPSSASPPAVAPAAQAQQAVVFPAAGQPLAVWREEDSLQGGFFDEPSAKWSASALGKTSAAAPAGAPRGDGAVLAWLERVDGKMSAHCRTWDAKAKAWPPLPDLEGVDGDSTVGLESAPDGTVYATLTWNAGLRPIRALAPGATAWTDLPLPGKPGGTLPSLAASEKAVAFSWVGEGGVHVARWTAGAWKELDARLSPGLATPAPVAIAPDGTLYAAWLDTGPRGEATAQLKVTRYRP